jgi:hypothetical protein
MPTQNGQPPRMLPTVPLGHGQAQYMNPMLQAQSGYGIPPGAQYGVPHGGMAQPGYAGMGQPNGTGQQGNPEFSPPYYNQHPMAQGMAQGMAPQGVPGTTPPGQPANGTAAPLQNTAAQEQQSQPGRHRHHHRRNSHRIRDILAELLGGTALAALAEHHHRSHKHRDVTPENTIDPQQPPPLHAPHGSALGFLHPKGHFQPACLEDMVQHFVHGNKEKGIAPEGARPGYLHTGGHFIPAGMEHLIEEFKHTLLHGPGASRQRGRQPRKGRTASSDSGSESEY